MLFDVLTSDALRCRGSNSCVATIVLLLAVLLRGHFVAIAGQLISQARLLSPRQHTCLLYMPRLECVHYVVNTSMLAIT
jgi:hypothetical protein